MFFFPMQIYLDVNALLVSPKSYSPEFNGKWTVLK